LTHHQVNILHNQDPREGSINPSSIILISWKGIMENGKIIPPKDGFHVGGYPMEWSTNLSLRNVFSQSGSNVRFGQPFLWNIVLMDESTEKGWPNLPQ
jgi:hypothetical protein